MASLGPNHPEVFDTEISTEEKGRQIQVDPEEGEVGNLSRLWKIQTSRATILV